MHRRALVAVYAVAALALLGPPLRMLVIGLVAFPVRGYAYLAMLLAFSPPSGLAVEWLATAIAALLVAFFWSHRAAPADADPTFAITMALATAAFVVVAFGSRLAR